MDKTKKHLSTKQLVIRITLVVAVVEFSIMLVLRLLPYEKGTYLEAALDASFLLILSTPAIYYFFVKPSIDSRDNELRDKAHLLSEYQRIAHIGGWFLKPATAATLEQLSWSDEMYHIFGVSPDTFVPSRESFLSLIHPDDKAAVQNWLTNCMAGTKCDELEFRTILPDGSLGFVSGRGEPKFDDENRLIQLAGTVQNITARKQAENQLDRFFDLSQDMLCISSADGYFKRVNPAFTKVLGWSAEEMLTHPYLEFTHPDDHAATLREVERQVINGEKVLQFENRYQHKDGSWRLLPGYLRPVSADSCSPPRAILLKEERQNY
ncbi:MAG: PAS domain-containing protein [Candidatus Nitrotoga sp.]